MHNTYVLHTHICVSCYRIYSRISRPAYKLTPIPTAENLAIISDPRISRLGKSATNVYLDLGLDNA